jgi:hypothetical protein
LAGLNYVNQVGAVEGMNQAGPGTLIPDTFLRWAQDILVDRAGLIRRRGPFSEVSTYKNVSNSVTKFQPIDDLGADYEVTLGMVSTYDPNGIPRIGMIVNSYKSNAAMTILRVFAMDFTYLGSETIVATGYVPDLSIISCKPALGGGVWISFAANTYDTGKQFQFFWRGGYNATVVSALPTGPATSVVVTGASPSFVETQNLNFDVGHNTFNTTISLTGTGVNNVSPGMFVFVTLSAATGIIAGDYYIGTVKTVNTVNNTVDLEKFPYIWNPTVTNNHNILQNISYYQTTSGVSKITLTSPTEIAVGDSITVTPISGASSYGGTWTVTAVTNASTNAPIISYVASPASSGTVSDTTNHTGTVVIPNSFKQLNVNALTFKFTTVRPYQHLHGRGVLSTTDPDLPDIISGDDGTSGDGRWSSAKVTGYNVYRASDNAYLGKVEDTVETITNPTGSVTPFTYTPRNTLAHLYQDHGASLNGENYIMYNPMPVDLTNDFIIDNRTALEFGGLYTAVYAGYQWYGNLATDDKDHNRVVFSAYHDREAVDLSQDAADSIVFPGKSRFRGMAASQSGLLVFLDDRTFIVRGNDRTNFSVEQLYPEGCLSPGSIVEWGGGVFWAGKSGILFYDGASVRNLTRDNLGLFYQDSLNYFDPDQNRIMAFMHKNNLVMHFTNWDSPYKPDRYEPIYATTWQNTPALSGRTSGSFLDPASFASYGYTADDLSTDGRNIPIYWERQTLNDSGSAGANGRELVWGALVTNAVLSSNVVTLTLLGGKGSYKVGDVITVSGMSNSVYNGTFSIKSVDDTNGTISYDKPNNSVDITSAAVTPPQVYTSTSAKCLVTNKSLSGGTATLTIPYNTFSVGNSITVEGVDSTFNGTYTITAINTTNKTISYLKTGTVASTPVVSPIVTTDVSSVWADNNIYKWGPLTTGTSITFNIYIPTNAVVTFSNFDFRGHTNVETSSGLKTLLGVNSVENNSLRAKILDIETVYDTHTNGADPLLIEKINIPYANLTKGPDFFIQTKHFTEGDPVLRKWFQRIMMSMLLYDGCLRMDVVDDDDNDSVDVNEKKHQYWETFTEEGNNWTYLTTTEFPKIASPNPSQWQIIGNEGIPWAEVFTSAFNRYIKRLSWRKSSVGFRLYQLNKYQRPYNTTITTPYRIEIHSFNIGFKALRPGRV